MDDPSGPPPSLPPLPADAPSLATEASAEPVAPPEPAPVLPPLPDDVPAAPDAPVPVAPPPDDAPAAPDAPAPVPPEPRVEPPRFASAGPAAPPEGPASPGTTAPPLPLPAPPLPATPPPTAPPTLLAPPVVPAPPRPPDFPPEPAPWSFDEVQPRDTIEATMKLERAKAIRWLFIANTSLFFGACSRRDRSHTFYAVSRMRSLRNHVSGRSVAVGCSSRLVPATQACDACHTRVPLVARDGGADGGSVWACSVGPELYEGARPAGADRPGHTDVVRNKDTRGFRRTFRCALRDG